MKIKVIAAVIMLCTVAAVTVNTVMLQKRIRELEDAVNRFEIDGGDAVYRAQELYERFNTAEKYISLSVNHEDLTNIEEKFSELVGSLAVGDINNARITKNRLIDALKHLRRLSGVNIDSVI